MASGKPLVNLIQVSRVYDVGSRRFEALRHVSLKVWPGEFVAIVGPSGSGKSTMLNLITGIDKPTSGEVWVGSVRVDGLDENALARWRGRTVGIVFQFFQLLPTLTLVENVALPAQLLRPWGSRSDPRAQEMLARVGLVEHALKLPAELSGGERQRAALARAMINDPPILVADEPTGNLDSATGEQIVRLFEDQHRLGKTVILVTHESRLAEMATRRVRMLDGRVADAGDSPGEPI